MKFLAVLPFLGILVGTPVFNRVQPLILGMPLVLAWIVLWIILTSVIMTVIYLTDPANRDVADSSR
jgi:xanthosine utilization system XapX-like protein